MRPLGESVARRRVFWFLVALVVVPTVLLAFYGLAGLKDQRDAAEARLRERYAIQARALEAGIIARIAEEDARVRDELARIPDDAVEPALEALAGAAGLVERAWPVDPLVDAGPVAEAASRLAEGEPVTFVSIEAGGEIHTVAVSLVRPGLVVAWELDPRAIDAVVVPELVVRQFSSEPANYHLRVVAPETTGEPVSLETLRRSLSERLAESEALVERAMAPPFGHWRVSIDAPEGGPTSARGALWTVVLLLGTSVLGVVLMGRAVVQQVRLSRLQTDFVSNVSHELRTPLTSIRLFVETLQSGRVQDPEKVRECLDVIAQESERLTRKIERVLTWARMEAGRRIYEFEDVRPIDLVKRALEAFRGHDLAGEVDVAVDVPPELPLVSVDVDAMSEALLNLVSNARKYGGPDVHIRVEGRADRRHVYLTVADDGPGVPREERKRIFEKFYRPDVLASRRSEGSGLGLAIVAAAVQAHKGRVDVESEEGEGARFTIRLKRVS
ncbi:MAG: sensor histidine kinase [Myxococcota bacterium]